jgi:hypothetical protein
MPIIFQETRPPRRPTPVDAYGDILDLKVALVALQGCNEELIQGGTGGTGGTHNLVRLFQRHGFRLTDDDVDDGEQPFADVSYIHPEHPEHHLVNLSILLCGEIRVQCIHINHTCHLEMAIPEKVLSITDVSNQTWYSCGSNGYRLGEQSMAFLLAIDKYNGVSVDRPNDGVPGRACF